MEKKTKELKYRPCKHSPMLFELYWEGGGELPESLSGLYTSESEAQLGIDTYIKMKKEKEELKEKEEVVE